MAKNKRDWAEISAKKGKRYNDRGAESKSRTTSKGRPGRPSRSEGAGRPDRGHRGEGRYEDRSERAPRFDRDRFDDYEENPNMIIGRNPVIELLKNDRDVDKLFIAKGAEGSINKIIGMAKDKGIVILQSEKIALDRMAGGRPHQGVVAMVPAYDYATLDDVFAKAEAQGEDPFVIILDNLEDPHNLGAIMRTAECAGAHGIIIPKRHSCGLTESVAKAAAGALEYMPCVKVANIGQTIDELKEKGFWIAACDMDGKNYYNQDLTGKLAIVIGSEGFGIGQLIKKKCDFVVSMPMVGKISSLNASNAAAVLMYEVRKQRDAK